MKNRNSQKGFTILVAVVTAGILLIIAMTIGGIALKEQTLSIANKESQIAFYAADTGMECALYWDQNKRSGGIFSPDGDGNHPVLRPSGNCNGLTIDPGDSPIILSVIGSPAPSPNTSNLKAEYSYTFKVGGIPVEGGPAKTCAIVTIMKDTNDTDPSVCNPTDPAHLICISETHTTIHSLGYNTCDASLSRLERGIEGRYP
jgi:type II secretory pathway pseudopilin PulG